MWSTEYGTGDWNLQFLKFEFIGEAQTPNMYLVR